MHLDAMTFMVSSTLITALACLGLLGAWLQFNRMPALLWWAGAHGSNAIGLGILISGLTLHLPMVNAVGGWFLTLTPAMVWAGVQRFNGRKVSLPVFFSGLGAVLLVVVVPIDLDRQKWVVSIEFANWTVYLLMAVASLWSAREEKLFARWPLMGLLTIHAIVFLGGFYEQVTGTFDANAPPELFTWFGMIHLDTIFYAGGTAVLLILMCKERSERQIVEDAKTDSLTGAVNRQAFFDGAERLLERCCRDGSPYSMVMFDLDHFKTINDTQGHQVGDRILISFAKTVQNTLRPNDLFGRYGGEEFLVVLPDASIETAYVIAERIRKAFADDHAFLDGAPLNATVSAGVASIRTSCDLNEVVASVDRAMYAAKHNGRNRVERAPDLKGGAVQHGNFAKIA